MSGARIVELGDTEPYDGPWRFTRFGRKPMLAVALGTFIGVATIGALMLLEHQRDEARAAAAPCAPPGRLAKEVVRTFLDRIARGDRAALGACWEDPALALPWADRLERTGGASQVAILSEGLSSDPLGRIANVLAMPTWRVDADVLWPSGRPKSFYLRDDGDGRWQLVGIRTPMWDFGSCMDTLATPVDVVRTFFAFLDERSVVGIEQCWVETAERSVILSRYLATGGATSVSITANREVPGGAAVRVAVQWRASPWNGDCCQRWFVLRNEGGRWRIASVEEAPPDR
ncbi:MAG: hypothetical protein ACRDF9_06080 [Candidatus Limnocylindria bacterium]